MTLQTEPLTLTVEKGNETEAGPVIVSGVTRKDVKNLASDIRFINVREPDLKAKGSFFVGSTAFCLIFVFLIVLAAACWFIFRKIAARRADVAGTKNRKATKMALKRLRLAGTFLRQNLYLSLIHI